MEAIPKGVQMLELEHPTAMKLAHLEDKSSSSKSKATVQYQWAWASRDTTMVDREFQGRYLSALEKMARQPEYQ